MKPMAAAPAASLQAQLEHVVAAAQAAWPRIGLDAARFIPYLLQRLPVADEPAEALRRLHTSDLYLACACAHGDAEAIAALESRYLVHIDRALTPLAVAADQVAEVKQQLRHTLLVADAGPPKIVEFVGRGDLRRWLRVIAVRAALALARQAHRQQSLADDDRLERALLPPQHPEVQYLKDRYRGEFRTAVGEAFRALTARDRMLLRQHFLDGLTIDQIGTLCRVHRATAARRIERAQKTVQALTRAALMRRLTVESSELDSILRLIRSQLDVSIDALLRRRTS
jgi:RNA polymerase sigma-70 factor (ECF subfamily)